MWEFAPPPTHIDIGLGPGIQKTLLILFMYLFVAVLGLHCCARACSSCGEPGPPSSCGVWASHCSGFSRCGAQALGTWAYNSCGTQAYLLLSMWDLPRPGIEPMSPALADGFLTIGSTRKSLGQSLSLGILIPKHTS